MLMSYTSKPLAQCISNLTSVPELHSVLPKICLVLKVQMKWFFFIVEFEKAEKTLTTKCFASAVTQDYILAVSRVLVDSQ